ncbi:GNAT family N-acetyltransferase [Ruegeria faecimaris]|uniref:L-amino acid N-acyltransferase YncA n=1 Tax=Ruegeria faecimaris TaxID=686389 RepID=A0A521D7Q9_9RHOB|nr:GNAT family N-acetyltransferase [Ruegeria faecimaris]SMO67746.1 L-amino acid N-acyltransferase YncA [Ruegeria faecimaris]
MSDVILRSAVVDDAKGISEVLQEIVTAGKRTKPSDESFAKEHYISHCGSIQCTVAVQGSQVLGFQALILAVDGNTYGVTAGWGIIGTHIRPSAARMGVGRALFQKTLLAARAAGLPAIDATIGAHNAEGLAYYAAMGFVGYRSHEGAVCKKYQLA